MQKIKTFLESDRGKDILVILIVILVGLGSFGLGRLSKSGSSEGIKIEYPAVMENQPASAVSAVKTESVTQKVNLGNQLSTNSAVKSYFASNRGSKYYSIGCSGGKTIKQENKIYFSTKEEAERAGYELSSSCR